MLHLTGTHKTIVGIEIAPEDALQGVINALRSKYGIGKDWWINDKGFFCRDEDYYHGSPSTVVMSKATPDQKRVIKACDDMFKLLKKEIKS